MGDYNGFSYWKKCAADNMHAQRSNWEGHYGCWIIEENQWWHY